MIGNAQINPNLLKPSGSDYVTNKMIDGAEQKKDEYYNIKAVNDAMNQWQQISQGLLGTRQNTLNNLAARGARGAIALKQGWDNANNQKQELMNSLAQLDIDYEAADTDEKKAEIDSQRKQISAAIPQLDKAITEIHNGMASLQQSYNNSGYDLSRYGSGVSLKEAQQNLQNDTLSTINQIVNGMPSSDEYYLQVKQNLINQGATEEYARERAGREASAYQAKRLSQLRDGFHGFGVGDDGAITDQGMQLLNLLGAEDSDSANMLLNSYALPKNSYATAVQQQMAELAQKYKLEDMRLQGMINQALAKYKYDEAAKLEAQKAQNKADLAVLNAQLRAAYGGSSGGGGGSGGRGSQKQNGKLSKSDEAYINAWENYRRDMWNQVNSAKRYQSQHDIENARKFVVSLERKGLPHDFTQQCMDEVIHAEECFGDGVDIFGNNLDLEYINDEDEN